LPGVDQHGFTDAIGQENSAGAFQHDEFDVGILWNSSITVVPVIAAVTAAVLIFAPPAFFGTRNSMATVG